MTEQPPVHAHCDERILHAPGECEYCDRCPEAQAWRVQHGVAFTGHTPSAGQTACPADQGRPAGSPSDHRRWGGNKPTSVRGDPSWPAETLASQVMYGDFGGRAPWPRLERLRRRLLHPWRNLRMRMRGYRRDGFGH